MAVLKYSDVIDSGLFVKTSTKGQPNGVADLDANGLIPVGRIPGGGVGGGSSVYTFRVNFAGGEVSGTQDLPVGWTSSVSAPNVTITHNAGSYPKIITYLGYNTDGDVPTLRYRLPTAANEMTIVDSTKTTIFKFIISSAVAAASSNGYALVSISF